MKKIIIILFALAVGTFAGAQTLDTVVLVSKAKKFSPRNQILLMFELVDTVDATGKKITLSRSYYFDESTRTISSVREYHYPKKPKKGTQVIYSFGVNKLTMVTVIPSTSACRNCTTRYYYTNDSLISKQGNDQGIINTTLVLPQAHSFQAKVPRELPWGFFNDEVIVNGKKKKIKKRDRY